MSDTRDPHSFAEASDSDFDQELIQMWQENTCPLTGGSGELRPQLAAWVDRFDRSVRWRNFREYGAAVIAIMGLALLAMFGDLVIAPLTGILATAFVTLRLWSQHRGIQPLDPLSDASAYRAALLLRYDQQIRLAHSARYWYVLPFWIFFLVVTVSGVIKVIQEPPNRVSTGFALVALAGGFIFLTALCAGIVWLNENYALRKLKEARRQAEVIVTGSFEDYLAP